LKKNINDNIHELLVKCLLNEASPEEQLAAERWMSEDPANRRYAEGYRKLWEESRALARTSQVDEDAAWDRFRTKLHHRNRQKAKLFPLRWLRFSAAAAAILVVCITGIWYFHHSSLQTNYVAAEVPLEKVLPDSSVINLNKHSSIRFEDGRERKVALKGEAFFNVRKNAVKPFRVYVQDAVVTVLGTSFHVRESSSKIEVSVETGLVQVIWKNDTTLVHPGEKIVLNEESGRSVKDSAKGALYRHFIDGDIVCDHTPLDQLVEVLQQAYGASIRIADADLKKLTITTTFHNMELDDILDIVSQTLGIRIEKNGEQYIIKP